jgi:K+ transporter
MVLPALTLNYLGRALAAANPQAVDESVLPRRAAWALYPMVALSTARR